VRTPTATAASAEETPAEAGLAFSAVSEQGLYRVTAMPELDPIEINELHTWTLHVETMDGTPVDGATLSVDGDMPAHGHGMPTRPQVTGALGGGDYLVEGMKFQMGGEWVIDVTIEVDGVTDRAHLDVLLKE
jgi:hypothetical protein